MVEQQRMDIAKIAPEAYRHLLQLEGVIAGKLDRKLFHLLKLRASQINGCAFCIGMHSDEALRDGDTAERLLLLDAWHESSAFSEKEQAALLWIEWRPAPRKLWGDEITYWAAAEQLRAGVKPDLYLIWPPLSRFWTASSQ